MLSAKPSSRLASVYRNTLARYLVVGGLSFVLDFGLLFVLHEIVGWPTWLATAVAFLASFVVNYTLQKIFSFGSKAGHGRTLVKYATLVVVNTLLTTAIVSLFDSVATGWQIGKVVATILTTVGNYFAYRHWVFVGHRSAGQNEQPTQVPQEFPHPTEHPESR